MSLGSTMLAPLPSRRSQVSMKSGSQSESPIGWPMAARNVKHMPPPMTSVSTTDSSASTTPSLSLTLAPPSTATNGRFASARRPPSTSASRCSRRPAALGRRCGGPTIDACARWLAPKASFTYASNGPALREAPPKGVPRPPPTSASANAGSFAVSPGLKRRFSARATLGASSAMRSATGASE